MTRLYHWLLRAYIEQVNVTHVLVSILQTSLRQHPALQLIHHLLQQQYYKMSCKNCLELCPKPTTDRCVEYTGEDIPLLGICTGDILLEVEQAIIEKLLTALDGTGITFENLTIDCDFLKDIIDGKDENLANIIKALVEGECTLRELVQDLQDKVDAPFTVNAPCLTLSATPTRDEVLAKTAAKVCDISTSITTVVEDYVKASELCDKVLQCIEDNQSSGETVVQEYTKMPKYVYMAYDGPLSVFDSSGKGLASAGYDKVYLANGNNNTKDLRGRTITGANTNVVGGTLDAAVDPSQSQNAGYSMAPGAKKGEYTNALTEQNIAAHTHNATTSPHSHKTVGSGGETNLGSGTSIQQGYSSGGNLGYSLKGSNNGASMGKTSDATIDVTISSAGSGVPHNNVQPSYAAVWIIYIP
mgnify:CR=1 FL=1